MSVQADLMNRAEGEDDFSLIGGDIMTGDVYIEDSVLLNNKNAQSMFVLSALCLGISAVGTLFASVYFIVPMVVFILMTVYFYSERNVAFDYTYTNGLLDIAKVRNNSKRKLLFSAECEALELMAKADSDEISQLENGRSYKELKVFVGEEDRTLYAALFNVEGRQTKILFEPCEDMLKAMKKQYPTKVKYIEGR